MRRSSNVLIVLGMMGRTPFAGVAWQVLHYLEGFRRLGHDVYYVEDTGDWPYDPEQNSITDNPAYTLSYIAGLMAWCGMDDRWAYRSAADGMVYGLSEEQLARLFERADLLINLTGATVLRTEHLRIPLRFYLETDPVLPQIEVVQGNQFTIDLLAAHTHHFSFGENLGAPDCGVPVGRFAYRPTRQPVIIDWWDANGRKAPIVKPFTTIANWQQSGKDVDWNGDTFYWSKDREFLAFLDLPRRTKQPIEVALACNDSKVLDMLRSNGWRITDAMTVSRDIHSYHRYIFDSRAEFTVAKDQNIRLRSGWFSDRSACYLAAGKPVITQDTGFGHALPTGEGLYAFTTIEDVLRAVDAINAEYERESAAARAIAWEYFRAETVLLEMLNGVGL